MIKNIITKIILALTMLSMSRMVSAIKATRVFKPIIRVERTIGETLMGIIIVPSSEVERITSMLESKLLLHNLARGAPDTRLDSPKQQY